MHVKLVASVRPAAYLSAVHTMQPFDSINTDIWRTSGFETSILDQVDHAWVAGKKFLIRGADSNLFFHLLSLDVMECGCSMASCNAS